jgi:predicted  nucleic acid-binding Zn-ribbon protein
MMTRCLSCGYLHHDVALNCPKCGSFYTEVVVDDETQAETKKNGIIDKIKDKLEHLIHHGENHD